MICRNNEFDLLKFSENIGARFLIFEDTLFKAQYVFSDYKKKKNLKAIVNPVLLWDYDLNDFNYNEMRDVVVQRVIERGWPNDWYAILNMYDEERVKDAIKAIPYLNDKDMNFVNLVFQIPVNEMKCYTKKQSHPLHWSS